MSDTVNHSPHARLGLDQPVEIVSCHAEAEVGDVIVGGVPLPPGDTVWDQSRWLADDQRLRQFVLNEPRGGVFRHVNLIVPPVSAEASIGFVIMEPETNPPMSGSNSICVATVALETGLVPITEPETAFVMEAPGGLVPVTAQCKDGKATSITVTNVASFAALQNVTLEADGIGSLTVDVSYGGDSFVFVDAADLAIELEPGNAADLARLGSKLTKAANEQLEFRHPTLDWNSISFCQIAGPLQTRSDGRLTMQSTSVIEPGKLDRSPTGTGVSARMALLHAQAKMSVGDELVMTSIISSEFVGRITAETTVGALSAILPSVTGRAWITGTHQHTTDPSDPWPTGYRLGDTWGVS